MERNSRRGGSTIMAIDPRQLLAMTDEQLQIWALSGEEGSYVHQIGETAMAMRCSLRMAEASDRTTAITVGLVQQTRNLAFATSGIVLITLVTQVALIVLTLAKH
jgi:hypothetical protein